MAGEDIAIIITGGTIHAWVGVTGIDVVLTVPSGVPVGTATTVVVYSINTCTTIQTGTEKSIRTS